MLDLFRLIYKKRGQATVYIIIGIILLIVLGSYGAYRYLQFREAQLEQQQIELFQSNTDRAKDYISNCISITGYEGLVKIGMQGGYITIPNQIKYQDTALWQIDEVNIEPTIEEIEKRLESYVDSNIDSCMDLAEFENMGYIVQTEQINTSVTFTADDVLIRVIYPVKIESRGMVKEFSDFGADYEIRLRKIWELASRINNRALDPDFNSSIPIDGIDFSDFDLSYSAPDPATIIFKIEDKTRYVFGKNDYFFQFAYDDGDSSLIRSLELNPNFETFSNPFTEVALSLNRDARLVIEPGTTFNLPEGSEISIQQHYPPFVYVSDIEVCKKINLTEPPIFVDHTFFLDRAVYDFNPTGTMSSKPMRLELYWDENEVERVGDMGIITDHGGEWHAIDSEPHYNESYITTYIDGFSNVTTVDCGKQDLQAKLSVMPWSSVLPPWGQIFSIFGHDFPIPLTLPTSMLQTVIGFVSPIPIPIPEGDNLGLSCVDLTPTCDSVVGIISFDAGQRISYIESWLNPTTTYRYEKPYASDLHDDVEYKQGDCKIVLINNIDEVVEDIRTADISSLDDLFEEDELDKVLSYSSIIVNDFRSELGLDALNIQALDKDILGLRLTAAYLQGGHTYQLCAIPTDCGGQLCVTGCIGIYK